MHLHLPLQRSKKPAFTLIELLIVIAIIAIIFGIVGISFLGKVHFSGGYFGKLLTVVFSNVGFWILFFLSVVFGVYRKFTNPREFSWAELPIQLGVSLLTFIIMYSLFFSTATDLSDVEIWNGHVERAEYHEAWTEKVTTKDSEGKTHTRYVRHSPEWIVETTAGNCSISSSIYRHYKANFGDEKKKFVFHMNQSSSGDGNMYYVTCDSEGATLPASQAHRYINYLRASDSIRKVQGSILGFKDLLKPYPAIHDGPFGPIEINRVVDARASLPKKWEEAVNAALNRELMILGPRKQVNVVVYAVGTGDPRFASALKEHWVQGKKNDVIVVLGMPKFPTVSWVEVISWTKVEEFKIGLRNKIMESPNVADPTKLTSLITTHIAKPASVGGFERMHMKDLEYLIGDISLPIWCQVIIVALGGAASWFTSVFLINNQWRQGFSFNRFGRRW